MASLALRSRAPRSSHRPSRRPPPATKRRSSSSRWTRRRSRRARHYPRSAGKRKRRLAPTPIEMRAEDHQREELEQHLGADHCGVAGRVVLRRYFDDIAADEVDALKAVQDCLRLARCETARFRCAGTRGESRVEAVDIERNIGRSVPDDRARLLDDTFDAESVDILD